jgi:hypothetical protein
MNKTVKTVPNVSTTSLSVCRCDETTGLRRHPRLTSVKICTASFSETEHKRRVKRLSNIFKRFFTKKQRKEKYDEAEHTEKVKHNEQ